MSPYEEFLARKAITDPHTGLTDLPDLPAMMFPFQKDITAWALRRGRAALFAGTGLGKSLMELAWADAVSRHTGRNILHLAPLAVSAQLVREADKFGIVAHHVREAGDVRPGINITNYQKIEHFDLSEFGGVILDESSILKSVDGHYRTRLIEQCAQIPFRLAATATPAPNDFMELGNHAEFLGVMSYTDMLATFFVHDGGDTQKWRLKGHAEDEFWKWMASWSVMLRKPSDLGYPNAGYDLPPLETLQHTVGVEYAPSMETGLLFPIQAATMQERLAARRATVDDRVLSAVSVVMSDLCAKYPECKSPDGNDSIRKTGKPDARLIQNMLQSMRSSRLAENEALMKTANTCEPTTSRTGKNGRAEARKSRLNTTKTGDRDTHQMPSIESASKLPFATGAKTPSETAASSPRLALAPTTTPISSPSKAAGVQFAEAQKETVEAVGSTLTTATQPDLSGGFSAATVTLASESSATIQTASTEPLNTSVTPNNDAWVIWCNLNSEQAAIKAALGGLAISIDGSHSEDEKEALHMKWLAGDAPVLICKPSMFGHGCNWQHCHKTIFVGLNDSFEQVYQAVRRFWRFGQTKPVTVHFIAAETEGAVVANLKRKEADADRMAAAMVLHMADLSTKAVRGQVRDRPDYNPQQSVKLPSWLENAA